MASPFSRLRVGAVVAGAFLSGIVLTAAFDLTPFGYAQQTGGTARPPASEVRPLAETGNAFVAIAEHVTPAVVSIRAETDPREAPAGQRRNLPPGWEDFFRQFGGPPQRGPRQSSGSGFIVSPDGYIMTNNHVVEDADRLTVRLNDGRTFDAKVIGRDPDTDVAVIKIDGKGLPVVAFGDDTKLRVGEWVVAIGNPLGLDFTVTAGIVSAKGRSVTDVQLPAQGDAGYQIVDLIQTDAAINPGNSGGPLVNIRGEVIGINNAIASQTGYFAGYGFAIPITLARDVMEDLIQHGRVRRAVIGVSVTEVTPDDAGAAGLKEIHGALVGDYSDPDSPAKRAGIQPNDVIVAVDGKPVDRVSMLQRLIRAHEPGETVTIDVMRYGDRKSFKVRLGEAPSTSTVAANAPAREEPQNGSSAEKLGIVVQPTSAELARVRRADSLPPGLLVTEVEPGGPAYQRLTPGRDVITEVVHPAEKPIRTAQDLRGVLADMKSGQYLSLGVVDFPTGQHRIVNLKVGG
ncbi:MAG TPA: Do family serine endopeptidase [Gemmatimonadaceae bacterium]|nr:Do family serine endopeptidase [Gemmatimonadaceae bacterium]